MNKITNFMDITLIAIGIFIFAAVIILIFSLLKSINKKTFTAKDGSTFDTQSELEVYQNLYDKVIPLFMLDDERDKGQTILGFQNSFLNKLKSEGFSDLKTLVQYRKQIKSLSDLINT